MDSMTCLRDRPRSFFRALPSMVSALVLARASAVSKVVMHRSSALRTHSVATSWPAVSPGVAQRNRVDVHAAAAEFAVFHGRPFRRLPDDPAEWETLCAGPAEHGITVNCVAPGPIDTDIMECIDGEPLISVGVLKVSSHAPARNPRELTQTGPEDSGDHFQPRPSGLSRIARSMGIQSGRQDLLERHPAAERTAVPR